MCGVSGDMSELVEEAETGGPVARVFICCALIYIV